MMLIFLLLFACGVRGVAEGVGAAVEPAAPQPPVALNLDGCVDYALAHALELSQQRLALANAELATVIARQKYAPGISAQAVHRDKGDGGTPGSLTLRQVLPTDLEVSATAAADDVGDGDSVSDPGYAVSLSKRILGGGSYAESMLEIDNSLIDAVMAANQFAEFQRDLVRRVVRQYYQLHRARQTLAIRRRRVELAKTNLEHAIAREDPLDIANAELEVPSSEAALVRTQREIDTALDEMRQLIGAPLDGSVEVVGDVLFAVRSVDVEADIRRSSETHEEVLNQRLEIRKLENELPVRRSRVLPAVDVAVAAEQGGGDEEDGGWSYETRMTASWTLFAGAERARVRQLRNQLADADLGLEILLRDRATVLRSYARRLDEALRQVEIGRQGVAVAARRAELYRDRWDNGEIDILEYIRSQNDLEQSRVDLVDLEIAYLETLVDYLNAVGDPVQVGVSSIILKP